MPRYFFHVFDGADTFDSVGTVFEHIRDVRLHMLAIARAAIEGVDSQKATWSIEAFDERGKIVGSLDFGLLT
jgi:hypothetical protein